ncbi:hypothetical protein K458DRAFT_383406 [Lentithecium fluviatile CBS 122367]|uniref:Uncharacterized protein n=1 Tax=Lentithecium fluviatile CBS 122367 TaxID=1168545 RepID=A0A6G1JII7_9PLEO|nr:hypothetical protein K458DRAFT_383406 [Lentithecium fluviatile CBS 122367]
MELLTDPCVSPKTKKFGAWHVVWSPPFTKHKQLILSVMSVWHSSSTPTPTGPGTKTLDATGYVLPRKRAKREDMWTPAPPAKPNNQTSLFLTNMSAFPLPSTPPTSNRLHGNEDKKAP